MPRFVIQEHHARSHHLDHKLKRNGVPASWAVPKGMPDDPKKNRHAIRVEDHAPSHLDYEDDTPVGFGGATRVSIWGSGTYDPHERSGEGIVVTSDGERVAGRYAVFRTDGKNWLVHRMKPAGEGGQP